MHADEIGPMVTWGNSPEDALPISGRVPDPRAAQDPRQRDAMTRTLTYMGLAPGTPLTDIAVDRVFIGRSEEHTSELQSLMRISYAVFCLKKKKHNTHQQELSTANATN